MTGINHVLTRVFPRAHDGGYQSWLSCIVFKAGADVLHQFEFVLHGEMQFSENFLFTPNLHGSRFRVELVLHFPVLEHFHPVEI